MKRIAIVTGASRGLGAVIADVLARNEFDLVLASRAAPDLERTAENLRTNNAVITRHGDLADPLTRQTLIDAARYLGGLNLLVNNASELGGIAPLANTPLARFDRVLHVNLTVPLAMTQAALPLLTARGGLVVNVSTDAANEAYPGWGTYGASKVALEHVSRTLAAELKLFGVGVVTVDPGDMRTRMHQEAFPGEDISDRPSPAVTTPFWEWLIAQHPMTVTGARFRAQTTREQWAASV